MEALRDGVTYLLKDFQGDNFQKVRFTTKTHGEYINGTTVEEVLDMLIHKVQTFQARSSSLENAGIIVHLQKAKELMRQRLNVKLSKKYENDQLTDE